MTIPERTDIILERINEIKQSGSSAEIEDMKAALELLGVTNEEDSE